jgi:hypothetical protein
MGEAKRRKQLDRKYGKKQPVEVTIKKKVSPLTAKEGYLVLVTALRTYKLDSFFYYNYEDAIKAGSIINLTLNSLSSDDWKSYFKEEGDACYPQSLIPNEILNQASEVPGTIVSGDETMEIIAYSEHTLATNVRNCTQADFIEVMIPVHTIIPEDLAKLMQEDNKICEENGWPIMWKQATIERLETRRKIEYDLIEDWVKSGIDRTMAELNIHAAKQEVIRKNGGWY